MANADDDDRGEDFEVDETGAPIGNVRHLHNAKALKQHTVMQGVLNQLKLRDRIGRLKEDGTEW
jgi:hypothetical protein